MTTRLYYTDAEARSFDATVLSCEMIDDRAHVALDRTAFYPTSGGQPFDTGTLGEASVVEVIETDAGEIAHILTAPLKTGDAVRGEIDWPRRLDHMQQHTGQHMLSAAFDRLFGVPTVSFHLGAEVSTIDLAREVTPGETEAAESEANRVVWDDRPVVVRFVNEEEASRLPLRKEPLRGGTLRLVEIPEFDLSACGGTHVSRTGVVGMIAIAATERFKGATRVTFVCGGRALRSHATLRDVVIGATRALSVTPGELRQAIERTLADAREAGRTMKRLQEQVAVYRAAELRKEAETIGAYRGVLRAEPELDGAALKTLASGIVENSGLVAVLVGQGEPAPVVIACAADTGLNASALLREATAALGGRGGGTATVAQGGLPSPPERVIQFFRGRLAATS
jgi:alanyl-tRNA synthetase